MSRAYSINPKQRSLGSISGDYSMQHVVALRRKRLLTWISIILVLMLAVSSFIYFHVLPKVKYNLANEYYQEGVFDKAESLYEELGDYKNSVQGRALSLYRLFMFYYYNDVYATAREYVDELVTVCPGAAQLYKDIDYKTALQHAVHGRNDQARALLGSLSGFANADQMLAALGNKKPRYFVTEWKDYTQSYWLAGIYKETGGKKY